MEDARRGQKLEGYQEIRCHMIFDIKIEERFTYKDRYVDGGHNTDLPSYNMYSRVVYRYSIIFAFNLSALNNVEIRAADIGNEYFNAKF